MEIDRQQVRGSFINAKDLVAKWKAENGQGHDYMPMIEAAHIGPVPISAITRVLLVDEEALAELGRPTIYTTKR